jgi:uncharacterized 2Fe-2S/4Fe-4S cluster protein (DUF4445 family)
MDRSAKHTVIFQPSGRRGPIADGTTLLEAARGLGEHVASLCGGRGACGKCQVRVESGSFPRDGLASALDHLSPFGSAEEEFIGEERRASGYRLACVARVHGDLVVFVPEESRAGEQEVRKEASERQGTLRPAVRTYRVAVDAPTLDDPRGHFERLSAALHREYGVRVVSAALPALAELALLVRDGGGTRAAASDGSTARLAVSVWDGGGRGAGGPSGCGDVVRVERAAAPDPAPLHSLGVAIDLGTTTIAAYLCDLETGGLLATGSMMNPQVAFGEDVMSRIGFAMDEAGGLSRLRGAVTEGLNGLVMRLTASLGRSASDVLDAVLVGNTAMHHIVLGLPPDGLGLAPYAPVLHGAVNCRAGDLGLVLAPAACAYVLPVVAGFVGADTMGVVVSEEPFLCGERTLTIDIGTNGELVMGNRERLVCASCATGPAFEGAHITHGMRAARGAIERVVVDPLTGEPECSVIGGERARGICGSGVIDAVAQMYRAGVIDQTGRFAAQDGHPRVRRGDNGWEYLLVPAADTATGREIVFTQKDVRAVQLGKGALLAGARLLMARLGWERLERVVLAGAFGTYIDRENAAVIGMFPPVDLAHIAAAGNAAGDGARLALLDVGKRREAEEWARRLEYVELSLEEGFQREFVEAMDFPPLRGGGAER